MNSKERVAAALACRVPDRVPFVLAMVDAELQEAVIGRKLIRHRLDLRFIPGLIYRPGDPAPKIPANCLVNPEFARFLELDAVGLQFPIPLFCEATLGRGGYSVIQGLVRSSADLESLRFPDVDAEAPYREAERFLGEVKGEFAVFAAIRLGLAPTILSLGYENFCYRLSDDPGLIQELFRLYSDWITRLIQNLCQVSFDFFWCYDDLAYRSAPLFSPSVFDRLFRDRLCNTARHIQVPWIFHSDGNVVPLLDSLLTLGMSGLHPLEPGAMDLGKLKMEYGRRLCLVGNIDVDYTLSQAREDEVEEVVHDRIRQLAPGGGYILSDSNSVPYYCKAANIIAMANAVRRYRSVYQPG
ncbi:MAG: hypothetical protein HXY20_03785 [Acidobacteria bacterium]|nr:hypothetical protein [Acidobacteriota bacterium]